jgi:uncharacterized protein YecE (DUF72 family)
MSPAKVHIGCSGWHYDDWKEAFYPAGLPKSKWLEYYSEHFDTVEVNNTFYRLPRPSTLEGWRDKTPAHFLFTLKGNREITHTLKLSGTAELVTGFYSLAELLGDKLGCLLWQLPPGLRRDDGRLEGFLRELSPAFRNVVEFRHPTWFAEPVYELLRRYQAAFCSFSAPGYPDPALATTDYAYLRFHGRGESWYKYDYSREELTAWRERLEATGTKTWWVYFNNTFHADAVGNARVFKDLTA